jgi:very-short-patch-repair endonuclease
MVKWWKSISQGGDMFQLKSKGNLHIKFRRAKRFRREMTCSEKLLWSKLRANRLPGLHFRRQHVLRGFILDFYCHKARLAVEIDGSVHGLKKESDQERDLILVSWGLSVIHLPAEMVEQKTEDVVRIIEEKCRERMTGGEASAWCPMPRQA